MTCIIRHIVVQYYYTIGFKLINRQYPSVCRIAYGGVFMHKQPEITAATRKRIMDAFWDIYKTTPIEKITISAITKKAGVHRSTFYEYFEDIYGVLTQLENNILDSIQHNAMAMSSKISDFDINTFMDTSFSFLIKERELMHHLLGPTGDPSFRKRLLQTLKPYFAKIHGLPQSSIYTEYLMTYVFSVIINALDFAYEHQDQVNIEDLAKMTFKLFDEGMHNFTI